MKKGLLTLFGAAAFATGAFATGDDIELYAPYMDSVNQKYSVKLDLTNRTVGLSGLTNDVTSELWAVSTWNAATVAQEGSIVDNKLVIKSTRLKAGDNWQDITLQFTSWVGGSEKKFGAVADTMVGQFIDLTGNVVLSAKIETNIACKLRFDLIDANGNISNSKTSQDTILSGVADYYTFRFDEDSLMNWYGGDMWGTENGRNNPSQLYFNKEDGDSVKVSLPGGKYVPVDLSKIVKIALVVNDAAAGATIGKIDDEVIITISELVIGEQKTPTTFVPYDATATSSPVVFVPANVKKVPYPSKFDIYDGGTLPTFLMGVPVSDELVASTSSLVVYPNPAKGQINVNEFATITTELGIATGISGEGVLDIASLTHGIYYVVSTTGSVKLIVE